MPREELTGRKKIGAHRKMSRRKQGRPRASLRVDAFVQKKGESGSRGIKFVTLFH